MMSCNSTRGYSLYKFRLESSDVPVRLFIGPEGPYLGRLSMASLQATSRTAHTVNDANDAMSVFLDIFSPIIIGNTLETTNLNSLISLHDCFLHEKAYQLRTKRHSSYEKAYQRQESRLGICVNIHSTSWLIK